MPDHAGDGQALARDLAVVVLAVGEMGIGQDGVAADGVEGDGLRPQVRRRGDRDGGIHHLGVGNRPLQHLHPADGAADHRQQMPDPELIEQQLLDADHVGDGDDRKVQAVGPTGFGIHGARPGRSRAAAQEIGADHEVPVRIDALARPDHALPPAGFLVVRVVVPGDVGIAAEGMADQDGVVPRLVQLPIGLIGDIDRTERLAAIQRQRLVLLHHPDRPRLHKSY